MTYEDFFNADEVAIFKKVKKAQMDLARIAREVLSEMIPGSVLQGNPGLPKGGKEFLRTDKGLYRLAMTRNSDNSTEDSAHTKMGTTYVDMSSEKVLAEFFRLHGLAGVTFKVDAWKDEVKDRIKRIQP
jgi:hypothetical protein